MGTHELKHRIIIHDDYKWDIEWYFDPPFEKETMTYDLSLVPEEDISMLEEDKKESEDVCIISEPEENYQNTGVSGELFTCTSGNTVFIPDIPDYLTDDVYEDHCNEPQYIFDVTSTSEDELIEL